MSAVFYSHGYCLLCVDPGLRGCGVAMFREGTLIDAAYVKNPVESGRGYAAHAALGRAVGRTGAHRVIIEHPRVYPGSAQQKGDLNDLLDVVAVGAAVAANMKSSEVATVFPSDWKGQVPKETMTERIRRSLTDAERATIQKCPASLMHNVLDACGIGLHALGRLNKKVYPHAD